VFASRLLLVASLGCALSAQAGLQRHYEASVVEASWLGNQSQVECRMSHAIPQFGTVEFVRPAGEVMAFEVKPFQPANWEGQAVLTTRPPLWNHINRKQYLGVIAMAPGTPAAVLDPVVSESLFNELSLGMNPTLTWVGKHGLPVQTSVTAAVSSARFVPALEAFIRCTGDLLPYNFQSVDDLVLYYDPDATEVPRGNTQPLERVATFCKADPHLKGIRISSYTGDLGNESDLQQFLMRSKAMELYLTERDIDPERVMIVQADSNLVDDDRGWIDIRLFGPEAVSHVNFRTAKWNLAKESTRSLDFLLEYLKATDRELVLKVGGHTDDVGRLRYNRGLSKQRAKSVETYLASRGVSGKQVAMKYFGEAKPVVPNKSAENRAINRRVEIDF